MRLSPSWLVLLCLGFAGCSDDKNGQAQDAVESADASTDDAKKSDDAKKTSSGSGEKASTRGGSGGAGGSKSASSSGDKSSAPDAAGKSGKPDESKPSKPSEDEKGKDAENKNDQPASPDSSGGSDSDAPMKNESPSEGSSTVTAGDQLAVCSRVEGDCNQGLACHAPAGPFSAGRGFCSKICRQDEDCSGLAPEGSKYTCSDGPGTNACELACSGAEDSSCPAGLACVQTGVRRRPVATTDAGTTESAGNMNGDAGAPRGPALEPLFNCRHAFEVSKLWGQCGDASHVCGEGLRCATAFWFGGAGHCTRSCEMDSDCEKPESGNAQPSCMTLVPAFGETPAVKQCALNCSAAKDGCPNGLACFEAPQTRPSMGSEAMPAVAWCQ